MPDSAASSRPLASERWRPTAGKWVKFDGREFLVEQALKADIALVAARSADYAGNLVYSLTARNFNPLMVWQPRP